MRFLLSAAFVALVAYTSSAQQSRPKRFTTPLAGTVVLADVEDKYLASVSNNAMPDPDADDEQEHLREIKEQVARDFPRRRSAAGHKTTSAVPAPVIGYHYVADSICDIPPDNCSAVSAGDKAVTVMNSIVTVHTASTGAFLYRKSLKTFSASVGLNNIAYDYRYDPKVLYDAGADRFICIILNGINSHNWVVIGFSKTNDPAGAWSFYKFYGDYMGDTTWFDYPAIAVTKDEFFFTGNKIKYDSSWQAGFTRTLIYQVRKADGYAGAATLNYQVWDSVRYNNKFIRCLHPVSPGDSAQGPAQYFLSNRNFDVSNDTVFLVKVPDTIGSASSTLTVVPLTASQSYGVPPDARQRDTSITLATNDGRILGAFAKGDEIQFVSTSLDPAYGSAGIYHGVISNYTTSPSMQGHLISVDTLDFGYPNVSFAGTTLGGNQSIINFNYSGPDAYPGLGAVFYNGSGYSDMLVVKAGDSTIKRLAQKQQRWGDYSGSQPDWNTPRAVWVNGIYGRKDYMNAHTYGNYLAQLRSPYQEGIPAVAKATLSSLYPNPAPEYISFEFTVQHEQVYSFFIYDMQGRLVDKVLDNYCREGVNTFKFSITALPAGTYVLRAMGAAGDAIPPHTFVKR